MVRSDAVRSAILADRPWWARLLITAGVLAIATVLRFMLGRTANPVPFVTYFPAILLVALLLGWRWAAVAGFAAAVIVNRVFLAHPWFDGPHTPDISTLAFFVCSCAFAIAVGDILRQTIRNMGVLLRERELLHRETFHRVQNMLSTAVALVRMSDKDADVAQFRADLIERLTALARANQILDREAAGNEVGELVRQAVAPFERDGAFTLTGSACKLPADPARHLLLILHELCTNALKHGALSRPGGRVSLDWDASGGVFDLRWAETGGPRVEPPARQGLGTRLLKTQQVFRAEVNYRPEGVTCHLRWPASDAAFARAESTAAA